MKSCNFRFLTQKSHMCHYLWNYTSHGLSTICQNYHSQQVTDIAFPTYTNLQYNSSQLWLISKCILWGLKLDTWCVWSNVSHGLSNICLNNPSQKVLVHFSPSQIFTSSQLWLISKHIQWGLKFDTSCVLLCFRRSVVARTSRTFVNFLLDGNDRFASSIAFDGHQRQLPGTCLKIYRVTQTCRKTHFLCNYIVLEHFHTWKQYDWCSIDSSILWLKQCNTSHNGVTISTRYQCTEISSHLLHVCYFWIGMCNKFKSITTRKLWIPAWQNTTKIVQVCAG